jgi:small GTP-binding protein
VRSEFNTERDSSETSNAQQQLARERAIVCVRDLLARHQRSPIELKAQLQPYLETLSSLQQKLSQPLIQIAVFGLVSRGKSAVLNALFGETIFPTGPLSGVTQWPRSVRWSPASTQEQAPSVQLELIDTPGLDEISGEARASMAQEIARCADLILFVTAGPPLPMEEEAIAELAQFMKPLLWVVNKADLYPELTSETLHASLANPTLQAILSPSEIVLTSAAPASVQVRHEWPDGRVTVDWETPPPQVEGLRQTLVDLLNHEGLYLLSLNHLLRGARPIHAVAVLGYQGGICEHHSLGVAGSGPQFWNGSRAGPAIDAGLRTSGHGASSRLSLAKAAGQPGDDGFSGTDNPWATGRNARGIRCNSGGDRHL